MSLSKTSVQPVDLDDLERQLREVAVSSAPEEERRSAEPSSPVSSAAKSRCAASSAVGRKRPRPSLSRAAANDTAPDPASLRPGRSARAAAPIRLTVRRTTRSRTSRNSRRTRTSSPPRKSPSAYSEEWEEQTAEEDAVYAEEKPNSRFDDVEQVPGMPGEPAPTLRDEAGPRFAAHSRLHHSGGARRGRRRRRCRDARRPDGSAQRGDAPVIKADDSPVKVQPAQGRGRPDPLPNGARRRRSAEQAESGRAGAARAARRRGRGRQGRPAARPRAGPAAGRRPASSSFPGIAVPGSAAPARAGAPAPSRRAVSRRCRLPPRMCRCRIRRSRRRRARSSARRVGSRPSR